MRIARGQNAVLSLRSAPFARWSVVLLRLALLLLLFAGRAIAFSGEGHQIIAAIAADKLRGTRAEREIAVLLGGRTLAEVSTWADRLKRRAFDAESESFRARNPRQDRYHYSNVPFQDPTYHEGGKGTTPTDVVHTIERCLRVLRGLEPEGQFTRTEALMLLVHLVGDLHQPLHVGCGYVDAEGTHFEEPSAESRVGILNSDRGGNLLMYRRSVSVHSWLDGHAVQSAMRHAGVGRRWSEYAHLLSARPGTAHDHPISDAAEWPRVWATDSLVQARVIYGQLSLDGPDTHRGWDVTPTEGFESRVSHVIEDQLLKAGIHLAELLAAVWPE